MSRRTAAGIGALLVLGGCAGPTHPSGNALVHWEERGEALPSVGAWAQPGNTWAPEVLRTAGRFLLSNGRPWQGRVIEAPQMVRHEGRYYLFYSVHDDTDGENTTAANSATPGLAAGSYPWSYRLIREQTRARGHLAAHRHRRAVDRRCRPACRAGAFGPTVSFEGPPSDYQRHQAAPYKIALAFVLVGVPVLAAVLAMLTRHGTTTVVLMVLAALLVMPAVYVGRAGVHDRRTGRVTPQPTVTRCVPRSGSLHGCPGG